jgi:hypothetical protein
MYLLRGFRIMVIKGDHEFASISDLAVGLPTKPSLDWAAASQHCGLIEQNIRFLKEKIWSLCHISPFERVPGIMVAQMVMHIVKFVNGFSRKGGVKHFSPGEIMTGRRLHANDLSLGFGVYCQVAENVEPQNSLAPRTRSAILLGNSGNLSGGQIFLALDTGHTITRHQWVVLLMPPEVIARVNLLGKVEPSILTFTDRHGREIGDYPREPEPIEDDDDPVMEYIDDAIPAIDKQDEPEIPGVWAEPTGKSTSEPIVEPTGVEMDSDPQKINFNDGLGQQDEEIPAPPAMPVPEDPAPPAQRMAAPIARVRKPPEKYVLSMKGNRYAVAMTQIVASLKKSKHAIAIGPDVCETYVTR